MRRLLVVLLVGLLVFSVGCVRSPGEVKEKIKEKVEMSKPQILSISHRWGEINDHYSEIITEIVVYNPNPVPIPLKNISVHLYMNGIEMGAGKNVGPASLQARSNTTIIISTKLDNSKIPKWWVSHIRNGETTKVVLKGNLVFDLKIFDFSWPFEHSSEIRTNIIDSLAMDNIALERDLGPMKFALYMSMFSQLGKVTQNSTEIIHTVEIENPNLIPIPITNIGYEILMNGIKVGEGIVEGSKIIMPKSSDTIKFVSVIDNSKLDDWWISHLRNGEKTTVEMKLYLILDIDGIGKVKIAIPEGTMKTEIKTNILKGAGI